MSGQKSLIRPGLVNAANLLLEEETKKRQDADEQLNKRRRCRDAVDAFGSEEQKLWRLTPQSDSRPLLSTIRQALNAASAALAEVGELDTWINAKKESYTAYSRHNSGNQPSFELARDILDSAFSNTLPDELLYETWDNVALRGTFRWLRVFVYGLTGEEMLLPGDRRKVVVTPAPAAPTTTPNGANAGKVEPRKGNRGRKLDTNPEEDKRIYDGWKASGYRTIEEYATKTDRKKSEVKLALDRHEKRLERAKDK